MELTAVDYLNGYLDVLTAFISVLVGILIIKKYFVFKRKEFLLIGIACILVSEPWWPYLVSFILILLNQAPLSIEAHLFLGYGFIPIIIICWFMAITEFLYKEKQKLIVGIFSIYAIIYEILFLYLLFTDSTQLGTFSESGFLDIEYNVFMIVNQIIFIILILVNGTIFSFHSIKSENPDIKLRGKLLLLAFYSFTIGAALDIMSPFSIFTLIFARFLLFSSAFEFYGGFILPKWMRKLFLGEE